MKIAFHGAARTVTGSKHLLTLKNGKKYLLDCGMFQGLGKETDAMNRSFGFDATTVMHMIYLMHILTIADLCQNLLLMVLTEKYSAHRPPKNLHQ